MKIERMEIESPFMSKIRRAQRQQRVFVVIMCALALASGLAYVLNL